MVKDNIHYWAWGPVMLVTYYGPGARNISFYYTGLRPVFLTLKALDIGLGPEALGNKDRGCAPINQTLGPKPRASGPWVSYY